MGRDTTVISRNPAMEGENIRSIIPADAGIRTDAGQVHFTLKPAKVHLFDAVTQERIVCEKEALR